MAGRLVVGRQRYTIRGRGVGYGPPTTAHACGSGGSAFTVTKRMFRLPYGTRLGPVTADTPDGACCGVPASGSGAHSIASKPHFGSRGSGRLPGSLPAGQQPLTIMERLVNVPGGLTVGNTDCRFADDCTPPLTACASDTGCPNGVNQKLFVTIVNVAGADWLDGIAVEVDYFFISNVACCQYASGFYNGDIGCMIGYPTKVTHLGVDYYVHAALDFCGPFWGFTPPGLASIQLQVWEPHPAGVNTSVPPNILCSRDSQTCGASWVGGVHGNLPVDCPSMTAGPTPVLTFNCPTPPSNIPILNGATVKLLVGP